MADSPSAAVSAAPLTVPTRFRGPAFSGNGGWTAGALAEILHQVEPDTRRSGVEVTLRQPPPLDTAMPVTHMPGRVTASHEGRPAAEAIARPEFDPTPLPHVEIETARTAQAAYAGHHRHPFPSCFACGTDREPDDGLRIFPGPVVGTDLVAAIWRPDPSTGSDADPDLVTLPITWAALDCIGGWASDLTGRPMVLGRMTAAVRTPPIVGAEHVVVGRLVEIDGRKTHTSATLFDAAGAPIGSAQHLWITIDPTSFQETE